MNISTTSIYNSSGYGGGSGGGGGDFNNYNNNNEEEERQQQHHHQPTLFIRMLNYYCFHKRHTDNTILLPWKKRIGLLLFALVQNGLAGGIIFGWASIDKTILSASTDQGGAGLNEHQTTVLFAYGSCVAMFSSLLLGILLDMKGPRICNVVCCLSVGLGCQIFAYSKHFVGFVIGACLLGLGGPTIGSSIIHIANLFPNNEFLIMSCLSGSIAFSFSILAIFGILWDKYPNVTYQHLFGCYAWIVYALAVGAIMLYPDEPYEEFIEDDINDLLFDDELLLRQDKQQQQQQQQHENDTTSETAELLLGNKGSSSSNNDITVPLQRENHTNNTMNDRKERHSAPIRLITTHDDDHHYHHIQSVATGRLSIEQPLNSYLRESTAGIVFRESTSSHNSHSNHQNDHDRHSNKRVLIKTDSFKAAETVLKEGDTDKAYQISLKDQPFVKQLFSPEYIRALVIFFVTCFVTNFYVASISTELADNNIYTPIQQHQMTTDFTIIISMGMIVSVVVGFLIDLLGIEICTAITLLSGIIQNLLLLLFGQNYNLTMISFVFYTIFRQFLYPVFIASLTARLGFKYFGILLGIGFAIAGIAQPAFTILSELLQGDCHTLDLDDDERDDSTAASTTTTTCDHGHWMLGHLLQIVLLASLLIIPWLDYKDRIQREQRIKEVLSSTSLSANNNNRDNNQQVTSYGSGEVM